MSQREKECYTTEWCGDSCEADFDEYDFSDRKNHHVERELAHRLESSSDVEFDHLVVRRVGDDAVCLEGVVKSDCDCPELDKYVKTLYDVDKVINRLVVRPAPVGEETGFPLGDETVTEWR